MGNRKSGLLEYDLDDLDDDDLLLRRPCLPRERLRLCSLPISLSLLITLGPMEFFPRERSKPPARAHDLGQLVPLLLLHHQIPPHT